MDLFGEENDISSSSFVKGSSEEGELVLNKKFAKAYQDRKSKEEIKRLATEHGRFGGGNDDSEDEDSETSESEDEDAEQLTTGLDLEITRTINRIRNQDPAIYDDKCQFYSTTTLEDENEEEQNSSSSSTVLKPHKVLKFKDVARQQILDATTSRDVVSSSEDEDEFSKSSLTNGKARETKSRMAYDEEQRSLRENLLKELDKDAGGDFEEGGGLLKHKIKSKKELAEEERLLAEEASQLKLGLPEEDETFLVDFMRNQRWKEKPTWTTVNGPELSDSEDEKDLDTQDNFEAKHNFRFQEEGGGEIKSYARNVQGSLRRQDDQRKKEREAYRLRKMEERQRKAEELRQLKKLKRKDIAEKLERIRSLSGGADVPEALLEDDFDPDAWDGQMANTFNDEYYTEVNEKHRDILKSENDVMQDITEDEDFYVNEGEGEEYVEGELVNGDEKEEFDENILREKKKDVAKLIDELYKLDYEDLIGDQPCRFKYRQVEENGFGLSTEEILLADDHELDEFVSMKKLAPYRTAPIKVDAKRRRRIRHAISERQKTFEEAAAKPTEDDGTRSSRRRRKRAKRNSSSDRKEEHESSKIVKGEDIDGGNTESNSSISQNKSSTGSDSKFVDTGAEGSIQKVKEHTKKKKRRNNMDRKKNNSKIVVEESEKEGNAANCDDGPTIDPSTTANNDDNARRSVQRKTKKRMKKATKRPQVPETAAKLPSSRLAAYGFG